jgi:hypothetical protein
MSERRSTIGFWGGGAALVLLVAILLAGGTNEEPLDPRSVAPDGAKALVDLLDRFGARVELGISIPTDRHGVALLLDDSYGFDDRNRVEGWVRDGGVLVVADPSSALTPALDRSGEQSSGCSVQAFAAIDELVGPEVRFRELGDATSCFGGVVIVDPVGDGYIISLGGPGPFLNDRLDQADNAVLAVALLAPTDGTEVAFLEPALPVGVGGESLRDLISDPIWVFAFQIGVGFLFFAWWRSRRLGAPVAEPIDVQIEGSELAVARGRLLEGLRQPGSAAADIRADTVVQLSRRLGLPPGAAAELVAERAAAAGAGDATEVLALLATRAVKTDSELLAVSQGLAAVRRAVFDRAGSHQPTTTQTSGKSP